MDECVATDGECEVPGDKHKITCTLNMVIHAICVHLSCFCGSLTVVMTCFFFVCVWKKIIHDICRNRYAVVRSIAMTLTVGYALCCMMVMHCLCMTWCYYLNLIPHPQAAVYSLVFTITYYHGHM